MEILEQINENWITKQLDHDVARDFLTVEFKFVLTESPDSKGYIRFNERGMDHADILNFLYTQISMAGQNYEEYKPRGGGFVVIPRLEKMISKYGNDFDKRKPKQFKLRFYGESGSLGRFNRELLERTLSEGLSKRFSYEIQ